MSTPITRADLDRRMGAWQKYFDDEPRWSLVQIAAHYHVAHGTVRHWLTDLGGEIRPQHIQQAARQREKRTAKLKPGEAVCECGLIYMDTGDGMCPSCAEGNEAETERQAEEKLFSSAAFWNNPRNIGHVTLRHVGGRWTA